MSILIDWDNQDPEEGADSMLVREKVNTVRPSWVDRRSEFIDLLVSPEPWEFENDKN